MPEIALAFDSPHCEVSNLLKTLCPFVTPMILLLYANAFLPPQPALCRYVRCTRATHKSLYLLSVLGYYVFHRHMCEVKDRVPPTIGVYKGSPVMLGTSKKFPMFHPWEVAHGLWDYRIATLFHKVCNNRHLPLSTVDSPLVDHRKESVTAFMEG